MVAFDGSLLRSEGEDFEALGVLQASGKCHQLELEREFCKILDLNLCLPLSQICNEIGSLGPEDMVNVM